MSNKQPITSSHSAVSSDHTIYSTLCTNPQRAHSLANFLASEESLSIIPNFSYPAAFDFLLTCKPIGPFHAGVNVTVPLWVALYLRRRNLCRLIPPEWMNVEHLTSVLAFERDPNQKEFSPNLPFRYVEISTAFLRACGASRSAAHASGNGADGEELAEMEKIRVLLDDIAVVRLDKIRKSVHEMSVDMGHTDQQVMPVYDVTNVGSLEIAAIRPFLTRAFCDHLKLVTTGEIKEEYTSKEKNASVVKVSSGEVSKTRNRLRRYR